MRDGISSVLEMRKLLGISSNTTTKCLFLLVHLLLQSALQTLEDIISMISYHIIISLFRWYRYFYINFWSMISIWYKIFWGRGVFATISYHIFLIDINISLLYNFFGSFRPFFPKNYFKNLLTSLAFCALFLISLDFENTWISLEYFAIYGPFFPFSRYCCQNSRLWYNI
jgi:hypothetical protein